MSYLHRIVLPDVAATDRIEIQIGVSEELLAARDRERAAIRQAFLDFRELLDNIDAGGVTVTGMNERVQGEVDEVMDRLRLSVSAQRAAHDEAMRLKRQEAE